MGGMSTHLILNEAGLKEAQSRLAEIKNAFERGVLLQRLAAGLSPEIIQMVETSLRGEINDLSDAISSYQLAKETGSSRELENRAGKDPGLMLIVARVARGLTQRELAWRMGMKEQQIQRYEADRYRSISLRNYQRLAKLLGVKLDPTIGDKFAISGLDNVIEDVSRADIRKILSHGRTHGWFTDSMDENKLRQFIAENRVDYGSPTLLRTGLNVEDHSEDVLLQSWRAVVEERARDEIRLGVGRFRPAKLDWLIDLPKLSIFEDGPVRAKAILRENGILLIAEPQIPGLSIDGAAFLVEDVPVIGLTLRRDDVGNFWFSLLHEVAHVILHRRTGLTLGFYDQFEGKPIDDQEMEANRFASELLLKDEIWRKSPARITRSPKVVEKFARQIGISPSIIFGRIQKERDDYSIFSKNIERGKIRQQLYRRMKQ
ncbi:ImmA/IrrE family metallo-endopeptidase [Hyphobacterium sp.]|uniref:ImmA/IrrE family metallo-endopeptidase n=1 Tax=Hyphobacterium sp. TaxID=2004662 RepID=UPI003BAD9DF6